VTIQGRNRDDVKKREEEIDDLFAKIAAQIPGMKTGRRFV